jgi:hypothetical protein
MQRDFSSEFFINEKCSINTEILKLLVRSYLVCYFHSLMIKILFWISVQKTTNETDITATVIKP